MDAHNFPRNEKRLRRLNVMSAALEFYNTRRTNVGRRSVIMAEQMRFAGEEAAFCIAEVKFRMARDASERRIADINRRARESWSRSITAEQRSLRVAAIHREIELLQFRPFSIDIRARERVLRDELALLQTEAA